MIHENFSILHSSFKHTNNLISRVSHEISSWIWFDFDIIQFGRSTRAFIILCLSLAQNENLKIHSTDSVIVMYSVLWAEKMDWFPMKRRFILIIVSRIGAIFISVFDFHANTNENYSAEQTEKCQVVTLRKSTRG